MVDTRKTLVVADLRVLLCKPLPSLTPQERQETLSCGRFAGDDRKVKPSLTGQERQESEAQLDVESLNFFLDILGEI